VATTKARYGALQQRSGDQQRSVNAAYAQLQDPSHNLAILMNWVGRHLTVRASKCGLLFDFEIHFSLVIISPPEE